MTHPATPKMIPVELLESLEAIEEYFDQRADGEIFPDGLGTRTNEEMELLIKTRAVMAKLKSVTLSPDRERGDGWIPVSERLPEDQQNVYYCTDGRVLAGHFTTSSFRGRGNVFISLGSGWVWSDEASHWMPRHVPKPPLPPAPEVPRE